METLPVFVCLATAAVVMEVLQLFRRGLLDHLGQFLLLTADLVLLGWAIAYAAEEDQWNSWQAWVGLVATAVLIFVPAWCDSMARRAMASELFGRAARAAAFKELVAPGRAATAQREFLAELAAVRAGQVDQVLHRLREQLLEVESEESVWLHERIATALVFAGRHHDAALHYQTHLGREHPGQHPALAVHMVRSYGETGDLARALELEWRLEQAALGGELRDAMGQAALVQAGLWLMAYAGEVRLLGQMLATPIGQRLSRRLRLRLEEVARAHAPDEVEAEAEAKPRGVVGSSGVVETAGVAGGEDREVLEVLGEGAAGKGGEIEGGANEAHGEGALEALEVDRVAEGTENTLRERIQDAGERLLSTMQTVMASSSSVPSAPVTLALFALNVAIYIALIRKGGLEDGYALVRSGASFHVAVRAGEWWRLVTALFLHDTQDSFHLHLIFNMTTLYLFGRHVEPLLGSLRYAVFYLAAGIAGNALSLVMHHASLGTGQTPGLSIGASGAVFGLVGALIVTLVERRGEWPEHWRRALLVNLIVLSVLQVMFGLAIPRIDNWAHIGGAFGGALVALLMGPGGMLEERRLGRQVTTVAAIGLGSVLVWAGISVARTQLETTLAKVPEHELVVGPVRMMVPEYVSRETPDQPDWPGQEAVIDEVAALGVAPHIVPAEPGGVMAALRRCAERDQQALDSRTPAGKARIKLEPAAAPEMIGWEGLGQKAPERLGYLYYGRTLDATHVLVVEVNLPPEGRHQALREAALSRLMKSIVLVAAPGAEPGSG